MRLPPIVEQQNAVADVAEPDIAGAESTADAFDAVLRQLQDEGDVPPHDEDEDEDEDGRERRSAVWPEGEEPRRPYLDNGFWVLPDMRPAVPRAPAVTRRPLLAAPPAALSADFLGHRHAQHEQDDGDDDACPEQELGHADGGATDAGEAKGTGNEADDGENDGPLDHVVPLPDSG
jgi:hypothetical protein